MYFHLSTEVVLIAAVSADVPTFTSQAADKPFGYFLNFATGQSCHKLNLFSVDSNQAGKVFIAGTTNFHMNVYGASLPNTNASYLDCEASGVVYPFVASLKESGLQQDNETPLDDIDAALRD